MYRELKSIRSADEVDEGLARTVDLLAREFSALRGEGARTSSARTPPSSGCRGGEGRGYPRPVGAGAIVVRADPSMSRVWNSSDGWPALPKRFPRPPQSGILQSL